MRLKFNNIGKISEADIELNSITVIAGNNDTGKSTVGKLLYAVSMALHLVTPHSLLLDKFETIYNELSNFSSRIIGKDKVVKRLEGLSDKYKHLFYDPRQNHHTKIAVKHSDLVDFEKELDLAVAEIIKELKKELIDEDVTTNKQRLDSLYPKLVTLANDIRPSEIQDMILTEFSGTLTSEMRKGETAEVIFLKENENEIKLNFLNNKLHSSSETTLKNSVFKSFYIENPFALDNDFNIFIRDKSKPYSIYKHREQLAIWLTMHGNMERNIFDMNLQKEIVEEIFSSVIDGDVKRGNRSFQYYTTQFSEPLDMGNVSTGIKSFAILKLLIETGGLSDCEFLILDEPEIHLHPEWQLKYAELIVLLTIHYPIRILLTSHSPYFVEAIELYSQLHKTDKGVRFYKTEPDGYMSKIINVTNCIDKLYEDMARPFRMLEELEDELSDE